MCYIAVLFLIIWLVISIIYIILKIKDMNDKSDNPFTDVKYYISINNTHIPIKIKYITKNTIVFEELKIN